MTTSENRIISILKQPRVVVAFGSFVIGLHMFDYYTKEFNVPVIRELAAIFAVSVHSISNFAYIVGMISFFRRHVMNALKRKEQWFIGMIGVATVFLELGGFLIGGRDNAVYSFIEVVITPGARKALTLLTLYLTMTASFRALRFRSLAAACGIAAMVLAMLYAMPIGAVVFPGIVPVGEWITKYVSPSLSRALTVTGAIGAVILTLRIFLGQEWGMYGIRRATASAETARRKE